MEEIKKAMREGEWVVCYNCGHKLGKIVGAELPTGIEIKCHSCKHINLVDKPQKRKEILQNRSNKYTTLN